MVRRKNHLLDGCLVGCWGSHGNVVTHWHDVLFRGGPQHGHAAAEQRFCGSWAAPESDDLRLACLPCDKSYPPPQSLACLHRSNNTVHIPVGVKWYGICIISQLRGHGQDLYLLSNSIILILSKNIRLKINAAGWTAELPVWPEHWSGSGKRLVVLD